MAKVALFRRFYQRNQRFLYTCGVFFTFRVHPEAPAKADAMRVGNDSGEPEQVPPQQVCNLPPHTGEFQKFLHVGRHHAAVVFHQHPGGVHNILRFRMIQPAGADQFLHLGNVCLCHRRGIGKATEEIFADQIHPRVGTLGGKPPHHQQPPGVALCFQRALRLRIIRLQRRHDAGYALFFLFFRHQMILNKKW